MKKILLIMVMAVSLFSCSNIKTENYKNNKPKLDIRKYLNGDVKAWGILENRSGEITRRFIVDIKGKWQGNNGVLDESFVFDDGKKSKRIWKIKFKDDHHFTAKADDVIGEAVGSQFGNAMQMDYVLDLVTDKETNTRYKVTLDDWMYLIDDNILVNKSKIKKFGITFGKLTIFFQKVNGKSK